MFSGAEAYLLLGGQQFQIRSQLAHGFVMQLELPEGSVPENASPGWVSVAPESRTLNLRQRWKLTRDGAIRSCCNGHLLSFNLARLRLPGVAIVSWPPPQAASQTTDASLQPYQWDLGADGHITSKLNGMVMVVKWASLAPRTPVVLWWRSGDKIPKAYQTWQIHPCDARPSRGLLWSRGKVPGSDAAHPRGKGTFGMCDANGDEASEAPAPMPSDAMGLVRALSVATSDVTRSVASGIGVNAIVRGVSSISQSSSSLIIDPISKVVRSLSSASAEGTSDVSKEGHRTDSAQNSYETDADIKDIRSNGSSGPELSDSLQTQDEKKMSSEPSSVEELISYVHPNLCRKFRSHSSSASIAASADGSTLAGSMAATEDRGHHVTLMRTTTGLERIEYRSTLGTRNDSSSKGRDDDIDVDVNDNDGIDEVGLCVPLELEVTGTDSELDDAIDSESVRANGRPRRMTNKANHAPKKRVLSIAAVAGASTGGLAGGAMGALVGSVALPGVGTAVVAKLGSTAGALIGSIAGPSFATRRKKRSAESSDMVAPDLYQTSMKVEDAEADSSSSVVSKRAFRAELSRNAAHASASRQSKGATDPEWCQARVRCKRCGAMVTRQDVEGHSDLCFASCMQTRERSYSAPGNMSAGSGSSNAMPRPTNALNCQQGPVTNPVPSSASVSPEAAESMAVTAASAATVWGVITGAFTNSRADSKPTLQSLSSEEEGRSVLNNHASSSVRAAAAAAASNQWATAVATASKTAASELANTRRLESRQARTMLRRLEAYERSLRNASAARIKRRDAGRRAERELESEWKEKLRTLKRWAVAPALLPKFHTQRHLLGRTLELQCCIDAAAATIFGSRAPVVAALARSLSHRPAGALVLAQQRSAVPTAPLPLGEGQGRLRRGWLKKKGRSFPFSWTRRFFAFTLMDPDPSYIEPDFGIYPQGQANAGLRADFLFAGACTGDGGLRASPLSHRAASKRIARSGVTVMARQTTPMSSSFSLSNDSDAEIAAKQSGHHGRGVPLRQRGVCLAYWSMEPKDSRGSALCWQTARWHGGPDTAGTRPKPQGYIPITPSTVVSACASDEPCVGGRAHAFRVRTPNPWPIEGGTAKVAPGDGDAALKGGDKTYKPELLIVAGSDSERAAWGSAIASVVRGLRRERQNVVHMLASFDTCSSSMRAMNTDSKDGAGPTVAATAAAAAAEDRRAALAFFKAPKDLLCLHPGLPQTAELLRVARRAATAADRVVLAARPELRSLDSAAVHSAVVQATHATMLRTAAASKQLGLTLDKIFLFDVPQPPTRFCSPIAGSSVSTSDLAYQCSVRIDEAGGRCTVSALANGADVRRQLTRALCDERTRHGRLLWRWLDWIGAKPWACCTYRDADASNEKTSESADENESAAAAANAARGNEGIATATALFSTTKGKTVRPARALEASFGSPPSDVTEVIDKDKHCGKAKSGANVAAGVPSSATSAAAKEIRNKTGSENFGVTVTPESILSFLDYFVQLVDADCCVLETLRAQACADQNMARVEESVAGAVTTGCDGKAAGNIGMEVPSDAADRERFAAPSSPHPPVRSGTFAAGQKLTAGPAERATKKTKATTSRNADGRAQSVCLHCGASLSGVLRGTGRFLGVVPQGFCTSKCAAAKVKADLAAKDEAEQVAADLAEYEAVLESIKTEAALGKTEEIAVAARAVGSSSFKERMRYEQILRSVRLRTPSPTSDTGDPHLGDKRSEKMNCVSGAREKKLLIVPHTSHSFLVPDDAAVATHGKVAFVGPEDSEANETAPEVHARDVDADGGTGAAESKSDMKTKLAVASDDRTETDGMKGTMSSTGADACKEINFDNNFDANMVRQALSAAVESVVFPLLLRRCHILFARRPALDMDIHANSGGDAYVRTYGASFVMEQQRLLDVFIPRLRTLSPGMVGVAEKHVFPLPFDAASAKEMDSPAQGCAVSKTVPCGAPLYARASQALAAFAEAKTAIDQTFALRNALRAISTEALARARACRPDRIPRPLDAESLLPLVIYALIHARRSESHGEGSSTLPEIEDGEGATPTAEHCRAERGGGAAAAVASHEDVSEGSSCPDAKVPRWSEALLFALLFAVPRRIGGPECEYGVISLRAAVEWICDRGRNTDLSGDGNEQMAKCRNSTRTPVAAVDDTFVPTFSAQSNTRAFEQLQNFVNTKLHTS